MKLLVYAPILLLFTLAVGGCRNLPEKMIIESYNGGMPRSGSYMDYWLNVREVTKRVNDAGLLEVMIRADNREFVEKEQKRRIRKLEFQYRFLWFDDDGFPVESATSIWQPVVIEKGDVKEFLGQATTPDVTNYRFEIRYINTEWR